MAAAEVVLFFLEAEEVPLSLKKVMIVIVCWVDVVLSEEQKKWQRGAYLFDIVAKTASVKPRVVRTPGYQKRPASAMAS